MASKLFIELQKGWDDSPYKKGGKTGGDSNVDSGNLERVRNLAQTKEAQRKTCKKLGDENVESGHLKRVAPLGGKVTGPKATDKETGWINDEVRQRAGENAQKIEYTCPHCGHEGNGTNMKKNHFDKCKGYIDVFHFVDGQVGKLVGTYNNQKDIVNDFDSISKGILSSAINGKKKKHHPHYVGGYVVIARGINNKK